MTEPKFTRCPGCATVFRVTAEQLALREGQVRCGQCRAVFDANDHLVSLGASAEDSLVQDDELMRGRPTVTLRSASALLPVAAVAPAPAPAAPAAEGPPEGMGSGEPAIDGRGPSVDEPAAHFGEPQPPEGSRGDASPDHDVSAGTEPEADGASGPAEALAADAEALAAGTGEGAPLERPSGGAAGSGAAAAGATAAGTSFETTAAPGAAAEGAVEEGAAGAGAGAAGTAAGRAAGGEPAGAGPVGTDTRGEGTTGGLSGSDAIASTPAVASTDDAAPESAAAEPLPIVDVGSPTRFEWKRRGDTSSRTRAFMAAGVIVLAVVAVLQLVVSYRATLAAHVPAARVLLEAACRPFGCSIDPLRDAAALSIDASDLQADPAHRGLLVLSATIRNRAMHAIAFPYLELTLTDATDRAVVRRAFSPSEYAGASADPRVGIAANGERLVRLFIDASATQQAGYRLYLFYP